MQETVCGKSLRAAQTRDGAIVSLVGSRPIRISMRSPPHVCCLGMPCQMVNFEGRSLSSFLKKLMSYLYDFCSLKPSFSTLPKAMSFWWFFAYQMGYRRVLCLPYPLPRPPALACSTPGTADSSLLPWTVWMSCMQLSPLSLLVTRTRNKSRQPTQHTNQLFQWHSASPSAEHAVIRTLHHE
jgi:hypothetical protein